METNTETISLDKVNIVEKLDELTNNLEQIEQTVKEISETKESIGENLNTEQVTNSLVTEPVANQVTESSNDTSNEEKKTPDELLLITEYLKNSEPITKLVEKLSIRLDSKSQKNLEDVLKFLATSNTKNENVAPISDIIREIKNVFADGKLDLYDIPSLINIVTSVLNLNISNIKIKVDAGLISTIIKFIIHILIELQIIHTDNQDTILMNKLIDSSILLLNTQIAISNVKCSLFSCCKKK